MSQFNTLAPDALDQARAKVHEATSAYELAILALQLVGLDRHTAKQAMSKMEPRTYGRISAYWPEESLEQQGPKEHSAPTRLSKVAKTVSAGVRTLTSAINQKPRVVHEWQMSVRRYKFSLKDKNKHIPSGQSLLPPELLPVKEAAQAAGVNPIKALEAVAFFRNPVSRVLKELETLKLLRAAGKAKAPTGLFIYAMTSGTELRLPASLQRQLEQAAKPKPEPLHAGEVLPYGGRLVTVLEVGLNITKLRDDDGTSFTVGTDAALRLRGKHPAQPSSASSQPKQTTPADPTATESFVQNLLERFKNREFAPRPT